MGVLGRWGGVATVKKVCEKGQNCTKRRFCAAFFAFFCLVLLSFNHAKFSKVNAKFSKVNAKFSKGVDF